MQTPAPTRGRWFRFSLRTLLVLVTILCIYLAWAMNWIRQREAWETRSDVTGIYLENDRKEAPLPLRILGHSGYNIIAIEDISLQKETQRLFPEASVEVFTK